MFESSLVASQQRHVLSEERWTAFASITLQALVAVGLVTLPLLHPERLMLRADAPHAFVPLLKRPVVKTQVADASTASSAALPRLGASLAAPPVIPPTIDMRGDPAPALVLNGMGMPTGIPDALTRSEAGDGARIGVAAAVRGAERRPTVSSGVSAGRLLAPIRPVYPAIARAAHMGGSVVVEAVISKAGGIESLRVVSGPEMLRGAATEAIEMARYRPFLLNGEATEVQTTITVNFTLGS